MSERKFLSKLKTETALIDRSSIELQKIYNVCLGVANGKYTKISYCNLTLNDIRILVRFYFLLENAEFTKAHNFCLGMDIYVRDSIPHKIESLLESIVNE